VTIDAGRLLEAHVAFELARWSGEGAREALRVEVEAVLAWAWSRPLGDVLPDDTPALVADVVTDLPVTAATVDVAAEVVAAADEALAASDLTVADLAQRTHVDELVDLLASWEEPRGRAVAAVTSSEAYSRLVAHVLYRGIKAYLLTENVIARRLPGASALVRLGQRGLSSAAPSLEAGVDRQLTGFVQANIADTLAESRRYLDATLDRQTLASMAAEAWDSVQTRSVAAVTDGLGADDLDELVHRCAPLVQDVLGSGLPAAVAAAVARRLIDRFGDRPVGETLDGLGVDRAQLADLIATWATPAVARAAASGLLEARVRARLEPFYAALPSLLADDAAGLGA
jgi:hypothetical protein